MPAAQPTQPKVQNVLGALAALGLQPGAIHVHADGSFSVDVLGDEAGIRTSTVGNDKAGKVPANSSEIPTFEDGK